MRVCVVSGQSGIGKDTVIRNLTSYHNYLKFPSLTTRPQRKGEINGIDYYFVNDREFKQERSNGNLLDSVCITGYWYGFPIKRFQKAGRGLWALNLVPESALTISRIFPETTLIYLLFPSKGEQRKRMKGRGMSDYEIGIRLRDDPNPKRKPVYYNNCYINDNSKKTALQIAKG